MKHTYVEFTCDYCGQAEHYLVSVYGTHGLSPDQQAKKMGWVIRNKKHFCCEDCYNNYKNEKKYKKLKSIQQDNELGVCCMPEGYICDVIRPDGEYRETCFGCPYLEKN